MVYPFFNDHQSVINEYLSSGYYGFVSIVASYAFLTMSNGMIYNTGLKPKVYKNSFDFAK